eukprot:3009773-Karenia_brevis.AAC.1
MACVRSGVLNVVGCNVCRCAWDNIEELLADLSDVGREVGMTGVYCLQEVSGWPHGFEFDLPGWLVIHDASSPCV